MALHQLVIKTAIKMSRFGCSRTGCVHVVFFSPEAQLRSCAPAVTGMHSAWKDGALGRPNAGWPASVGVQHGGPRNPFTTPPQKETNERWPKADGGWSKVVKGEDNKQYRGFRGVATGGLGHRGKFRGFIAVSFRRNATGFRPQGHLRPPAHPKIARSLGNRRGRRQAAADDERQRLQKYACKRQNLAYKTPPFARF